MISAKLKIIVLLCFTIYISCTVSTEDATDISITDFKNPPAESRPFVRWWWNGNKVNKEEIARELDVLKEAGFGGVEINPIQFPATCDKVGAESLTWMSDAWIDNFVYACQKTQENGMIADAVVGSGWPFGGEFLNHSETIQRVLSDVIEFKNTDKIDLSVDMLKKRMPKEVHHWQIPETIKNELLFVTLIPLDMTTIDNTIDLLEKIDPDGNILFQLAEKGDFLLSYGFIQKDYRSVVEGTRGASGSVMDHYKKDVTLSYLSRLLKVSEKTGIPLKELLRALFCDSIELSGANWTDGFAQRFYEAYGYELEPWFPWVFDATSEKNGQHLLADDMQQSIKRVRYDYNALLVETFLSNFTQTYQDFCTNNGLKCRYQAYGSPFLMGMLDGYSMVDIPESNNWIYSGEMKTEKWTWNQSHGYMIRNFYAAAGGQQSGRRIISTEAMTNLNGVFRTTLEEIKQHDDMNFITGINHSVLHGFNYSPPEAGFPGWLKFGSYFSEQNTWWPYIDKWVDYNARLSYVFQNSKADKSIAIIGPTADHWGDSGLGWKTFNVEPWYLHRMWEPVSQLGYSCDYINLGVLNKADVSTGSIRAGSMNYKLLVLAGLKSMHPATAQKIEEYVKSGGQLLIIGETPYQSLHFMDAKDNDHIVRQTFERINDQYAQSVVLIDEPPKDENLLTWMKNTLNKSDLLPEVRFDKVYDYVYQISKFTSSKNIYFITNVHRDKAVVLNVAFPVKGKYPYIWNPETGEKMGYAYDSDPSQLNIKLGPIESILLVYEDEKPRHIAPAKNTNYKKIGVINGLWDIEAKHINGNTYNWKLPELLDLAKEDDPDKASFAGTLIYKSSFEAKANISHIDLGEINEGIVELFVNGKNAGLVWYGQPVFNVEEFIKEGVNEIEIRYTTVLANYCKSLKDNLAAQYWTKKYADINTPTGIEGPVRLLILETV